MKIPFNRPVLAGRELELMADAIQRMHISGDGHYTKLCAEFLERLTGARRALLTTSCTHALELAAILLDLGPGDEVVMPAFTFVSTANAVVLRGARPVFVDIRADTLNLDERLLESAITENTKAIFLVHYAGIACDMTTIGEIARRRAVPVVEDNAHGLFGSYRGSPLGSFGLFATQSFHETKNVICGEGGALLVNDPAYVERAEIVREKGTNRTRFFRGQIDKYSWVEPGSSYLASDLLAAFLYAQFEAADRIQAHRRTIWERYDDELREWSGANGIVRPTVPPDRGQAYHLYYLLLPTIGARAAFIEALREREVASVFHYVPLHVSEFGMKLGYAAGDLPVTESCSDRLVRLPLYNDMSTDDQTRVIETVKAFTTISAAIQ